MTFRKGAWLGIDVGSSRSKVVNLCFIASDGPGTVTVTFERGQVREAPGDARWPANNAAGFLDLARSTWLTQAVELGVRNILERSALVRQWSARLCDKSGVYGAAVDAPCGFARPGEEQRDTESAAVNSFKTPARTEFLAQMRRFATTESETPLRQRYFWKLVGLVVLRDLLARAGVLPFEAGVEQIATLCVAGLVDGGHGALEVEGPRAGEVRVREAFPSDTYARANGQRGVLGGDARALFDCLVSVTWGFTGNQLGRASSTPTKQMQQRLEAQRASVSSELRRGGAVRSMVKIPGDPSWADLWDAFACAFVVACEAHGAAVLLGTDSLRLRAEGAILAPRAGLPCE